MKSGKYENGMSDAKPPFTASSQPIWEPGYDLPSPTCPLSHRLICTAVFDPAFKVYETTSGIDLSTAMGYNRSSLLSAAGGTLGTDYIENLNEANLNSLLRTYSGNLSDFIRNNYPNASMEEIIGGRQIIPEYSDELPTGLEFSIYSQQSPWAEIPAAYNHTITIRHGGIEEVMDIASLGGRRLSISYAEAAKAASSYKPAKLPAGFSLPAPAASLIVYLFPPPTPKSLFDN